MCVGAQNFLTLAPTVQGRALRPGGRGGPERVGSAVFVSAAAVTRARCPRLRCSVRQPGTSRPTSSGCSSPRTTPPPSRPPHPQQKVRASLGWAPLRAASGDVCSHEDRRDPGWARGIFRLERKKARWSPVLSGHPLDRLATSGFVPLASASSPQGCNWLGWLQALAFSP